MLALLYGWKFFDSCRIFDLGDSLDHAGIHLTYCLKSRANYIFLQDLFARHFQFEYSAAMPIDFVG